MDQITGILLAAGSSQRFGSDKLMQALPDGIPVAVHACCNLLTGVDKLVAVLRPGNEVLAACLKAEGASVRICGDAAQGMGASLAFGVAVSPESAGWLIALADMPWISPVTINKVADALRAGAIIAAPSWQGLRGHPVGFSGMLRRELLALNGDTGAKPVIQSHQNRLHLIECDDPGILIDVDYPDDLNQPSLKPSL